jgi:hypothetical protein
VKCLNARAALLFLGLGLAAFTPAQAEDYYIYHDPHGKLFISNQEPPPVSKIIKQRSWPDVTDSEIPQSAQPNNSQPNGPTEGLPKPFQNK